MNRYKYLMENPDKKIKVESAEEFLKLVTNAEGYYLDDPKFEKRYKEYGFYVFHPIGIENYFGSLEDDEFKYFIEEFLLDFLPNKECNVRQFNHIFEIYCYSMLYVFQKSYNISYRNFQKERVKSSKFKMLNNSSLPKRKDFITKKLDEVVYIMNELFIDDELGKIMPVINDELGELYPLLLAYDLNRFNNYIKSLPTDSIKESLSLNKTQLKNILTNYKRNNILHMKVDNINEFIDNLDTLVKVKKFLKIKMIKLKFLFFIKKLPNNILKNINS